MKKIIEETLKDSKEPIKDSAGSMLSQKTNEDFNKQKPDTRDPNFKTFTTYTCAMHAGVKMGKPGKCPRCGMELVENK